MGAITPPPFMLYVVWHPDYAPGEKIAALLYDHFGAHRYRNIAGGAGVRVIFRNISMPGASAPMPIDWGGADTVAAVVLLDRLLKDDHAWAQYVHELANEAETRGLNTRVFPVSMDADALEIGLEEQAFRWDRWAGTDKEREQRLVRDLTYQFSRMLRHRLAQLQHPNDDDESLEGYLKKIQVFLSHSKHDNYGERISEEIRDWLHLNSELSSFLDVHDIPTGLSFSSVIIDSIQNGVVVVIYTDSYSSREWCRREVIEAKRRNVPMLVVDCLQGVDERLFPYLGNVPIIRMNPDRLNRIDQIAGRLLDEVFNDFLWRCRVERLRRSCPQTLFMARSPELLSLTSLPATTDDAERSIVYPDPPLSTKEAQLFADVSHDVLLYTLTEWLRENGT